MSRLPLGPEVERGRRVEILIDGVPVVAHEGETVAAALLARGEVATRRTVSGKPRGIYCGMGVCFDCLVIIDDVPNTRACVTWVREGMRVSRQDGFSPLET